MQPPSYTSLKLLTGPPRGGGGDTLWSSQYAAYDALSSHMQTYLKGLTALHSADMQANDTWAVTTEHPLIRTNPVTGWNALFFNPGFVTKIVGVPKTESDAIMRYLTEVISTTQEMHIRFQWGKNDVAFWDNRSTVSVSSAASYTNCFFENCFFLSLLIFFCIGTHRVIRLCTPSPTCRAGCFTGRASILGSCRYITRGGICCSLQPTESEQGWGTAIEL